MKIKQIKELVTKLGNKEQQELIKRFGRILPDDGFLQLDPYHHIFGCDKCGELGHFHPDFKACPKCGNTNFRNYEGKSAHVEFSNKIIIGIITYEANGVTAKKICWTQFNEWATERNIEEQCPDSYCVGLVVSDGHNTKLISEKWNGVNNITMPRIYRSNRVEYGFLSLRWDGNCYVIDDNDENDYIYARLRGKTPLTAEALAIRKNQTKWQGPEPYLDQIASFEFKENATVDQYGLVVGEGKCGKCGGKITAQSSYNVTNCPHCGAFFEKRFFDTRTSEYHVMSHFDVITGNLQLLLFRVTEIYRNGIKEPYKDTRYLAEITEKGEITWYRYLMGSYLKCPSSDVKVFVYDSKSLISALDMYEGTKYTGWGEYQKHSNNVLGYLTLASEHPEVEKLVKGGLLGAVDAMIQHGYPKKLSQLSPTKSLRKLLVNAYSGTDLEALVECYARDNTLDYETFIKIEKRWRNAIDIFRVKIPGMSWAEIVKYLDYVDQFQACPPYEALQLWADYLKMYKKLGGDLTDRRAVYPNSLKREHDKASRKVQLIRDETKMARFNEVVKDANYKKLAYDDAKYGVLVPQTAEEMFEEGRQLSHCVGAYVDDVADKRCKILFVRKQSDRTKSLATMEVRGNSIVQLKGYANNRPSKEVVSFARDYAANKGLLWCV